MATATSGAVHAPQAAAEAGRLITATARHRPGRARRRGPRQRDHTGLCRRKQVHCSAPAALNVFMAEEMGRPHAHARMYVLALCKLPP